MPISEFSKAIYGDILESGYIIDESITEKKISVYAPNITKKNINQIVNEVLNSSGLSASKVGNLYHIQDLNAGNKAFIYKPKNRPVRYIFDLLKQAYPELLVNLKRDNKIEQQGNAISNDEGINATVQKRDFDFLIIQTPKVNHSAIEKFLNVIDIKNQTVRIVGGSYEFQNTESKGSAFEVILDMFSKTIGLTVGATLEGASAILTLNGLGITSVFKALDSDSRFKSVSKPSLLVDSGEHANFNAGQDVPVLTSTTVSNGQTTQGVEYRSSGVLLDVMPTVYDDSIDVKIKQEISSFSKTQLTNIQSPTLNKRLIDTRLSLKNGDIVILAGLTEYSQNDNRQKAGIFNIFNSNEKRQAETVLILQVQTDTPVNSKI